MFESNDVIGLATVEPSDMGKAKSKKLVPPPDEVPKTLFAIKGLPSWYEWLRRYADFRRMSVVGIIDFALNEQARRDGFDPMPKRFP